MKHVYEKRSHKRVAVKAPVITPRSLPDHASNSVTFALKQKSASSEITTLKKKAYRQYLKIKCNDDSIKGFKELVGDVVIV